MTQKKTKATVLDSAEKHNYKQKVSSSANKNNHYILH